MVLYLSTIKELFKNEEAALRERKNPLGGVLNGHMAQCYRRGFRKNFKDQIFFQDLSDRGTALAKLAGLPSEFFTNF